jgi:hypothetical protein
LAWNLSHLPVVPLQADLAAVALLGIGHVERIRHRYFRGRAQLSDADKAPALPARPGPLRAPRRRGVLKVTGGTLACASLQVPGMGFAALPDVATMIAPDAWDFASLGQEA